MRNKQILPHDCGYLSRIIDSPFSSFIDEFFSEAFPLSIIDRQDSYPKYNIVRKDKDTTDKFTVELSLAGFSKECLRVTTENDTLFVESTNSGEIERDYLYKGIASRSFKWKLNLPKFSVIKDITFIDGILAIKIAIEIPEEKKPKVYEIK